MPFYLIKPYIYITNKHKQYEIKPWNTINKQIKIIIIGWINIYENNNEISSEITSVTINNYKASDNAI